MNKVLVITDTIGTDISAVKQALEKESLSYETIHAGKSGRILSRKWRAVVLLFDSVSNGTGVAEQLRKSKVNRLTPIMRYLPTSPTEENLFVVPSLDFIATATANVLKTRMTLRRSGKAA